MLLFIGLFILRISADAVAKEKVCIHEDFNTLNDWKPLLFAKIHKHSLYNIEQEGDNKVLKAVADDSASGLVYSKTFDIRQCPIISWRWKVKNVYAKGNALTRSGDDYPLRIYVLFKYDPASAGLAQRIEYNLIKSIRGEFPPDSSLNYIWANRQPIGSVIPNAYTDRAMMIVVETGRSRLNSWITEQVDALADYRRAFGHEPPKEARLAVMSDADNTGESATAWLDFIEVRTEGLGKDQ